MKNFKKLNTRQSNHFIKLFASIFICISILFSGTQKSYAIFGVGDTVIEIGQNLITNIVTTIEQTMGTVSGGISAYSDTWQVTKEGVLDTAAQYLAKTAVESIKKQTINWVNSGFKGKPMFLQNPDQFFNNIMVDQLALVKNKMMADLGNLNRGITQQLIKDVTNQSKVFQQNMQYTIANDICAALKSDLASYQAMPNSSDKTQLISAKNNQINSVCNGDVTTRDANAKACAGDFSCGGWAAILAKTSNLDLTTDAGKLAMAKQEVASNTNKVSTDFNNQLNRSNGVLDQQECVKYEKVEGREICKQYNSTSPGITVTSALTQVVTDPINSLNQVHEMGESWFTQFVTAFANQLISKGVSKLSSSATAAIGDVSNELQTALNDLANGRDSGSATSTGTTTINTSIFGDNPGARVMSPQDRNALLNTVNPKYDFIMKNYQQVSDIIGRRRDAYTKLKNALDQVAQCYKDKSVQYPSLVSFPTSVPQKLRDRASQVNTLVDSLNQAFNTSTGIKQKVDEIYDKMNKTTDFMEFRDLMDQFDALYRVVTNGAEYWQVDETKQNAGNGSDGIYAQINKEIESVSGAGTTSGTGETMTTVPSALAQCQAIGTDMSGGVGGF